MRLVRDLSDRASGNATGSGCRLVLVLDGNDCARAVAGAALVVLLLVLASLLLLCSSCCCLQALTHDVVVVKVVMVVVVMGYGSGFVQAAGATQW